MTVPKPPLWLLETSGWGEEGWKMFKARNFRLRYPVELLNRIAALHEKQLVEVQWLTTWGRYANEDLREEFGLPELVVAGESPFREHGGWWKLPIAQKLYDKERGLIWTDDDIAASHEAMKWIDAQTGPDLRAYAPGGVITREEMDGIEKWLEARNGNR